MSKKNNVIDMLLGIDLGEVVVPTTTKEIYLKKVKKQFNFECSALDAEKASDIQMKAMDLTNGSVDSIDMFKLKAYTVIEGCKDVFKNKEILNHFGAPSSLELVRKLFLDGELTELYTAINELSSCVNVEAGELKN